MWNWDKHSFPAITCENCPAIGPQLAPFRKGLGCPKEGAKGKAKTGEHPLRTCPGWYWDQGTTWQLRDIRDAVPYLGDLDNKSNLVLQVALKFQHFSAWKHAEEQRALARAQEAEHGATR